MTKASWGKVGRRFFKFCLTSCLIGKSRRSTCEQFLSMKPQCPCDTWTDFSFFPLRRKYWLWLGHVTSIALLAAHRWQHIPRQLSPLHATPSSSSFRLNCSFHHGRAPSSDPVIKMKSSSLQNCIFYPFLILFTETWMSLYPYCVVR
jgi:hypothetical protein